MDSDYNLMKDIFSINCLIIIIKMQKMEKKLNLPGIIERGYLFIWAIYLFIFYFFRRFYLQEFYFYFISNILLLYFYYIRIHLISV